MKINIFNKMKKKNKSKMRKKIINKIQKMEIIILTIKRKRKKKIKRKISNKKLINNQMNKFQKKQIIISKNRLNKQKIKQVK